MKNGKKSVFLRIKHTLYDKSLKLFMDSLISKLSSLIWGWPMIVMLLGTHLYLTIRLRFPQRYLLKAIKLSLTKDHDSSGDVSQFGALATALAATIGTGNIIGVATAISLGGPGAVLWCWLTGVFGIATKYSEAYLSVKYRIKTRKGKMIGGPMYVLQRGLGMRSLGVLFAIFAIVASFGIGNMVQCNAISYLCHETYGISPVLTSAMVTLLAAMVILAGVKGIAHVCTALVPFMALFYVVGCIVILFINGSYVIDALCLIFRCAFDPASVSGGFVGSSIMLTARYGIARGLFSNESGMGSAPIVSAAARTRSPERQALVASTATFWDTVVVCALTGLVIVSSILSYGGAENIPAGSMTKHAFEHIPIIGSPLLAFGILTFAFSTILGWSYYGEKCAQYLGGRRWGSTMKAVYRILFIPFIFIGGVSQLESVWNFSDLANGLMAIPNLISLILLAKVIKI